MVLSTKNNNIFRTRETPLAAYLITVGYSLLDIIYENEFAIYLFVNDNPTFQQHIRDFELLRAEAPAPQLITNYQNLIKRIRRKL